MQSQRNITYGERPSLRLNFNVTVRGGLHSCDQGFSGDLALETTKLFLRNDDNLITTMHSDVLRALTANPAHELAEARLGILKHPVTGLSLRHAGFRGRVSRFIESSHAD
jgi:hypothetical protein